MLTSVLPIEIGQECGVGPRVEVLYLAHPLQVGRGTAVDGTIQVELVWVSRRVGNDHEEGQEQQMSW